jgi:protein phosphatase
LFGGSEGLLLLVADGMGGHLAGKQASAIAIRTLEHYLLNTMPWCFRLQGNEADDCTEDLKTAMEACHRSVEAAAEANAERRGMGTTLTMAYVVWPRLYVVHVGDSRCYLFRPPRLERVTTDHTLAQQLVERGALDARDAAGSRWSHVLWNCIGGNSPQPRPEVYKATLHVGDVLLLCTDGLTRKLRDEQLVEMLSRAGSAEETCRRLVTAANEAGGQDNITAVVARFLDASAEADEQQAAQAGEKMKAANGKAVPV